VSKIRASRISRNSSNMLWLTLRIRVAVLACLWPLTKDFRVFEKLGVVMSPDDKTRHFCPEELTALGL